MHSGDNQGEQGRRAGVVVPGYRKAANEGKTLDERFEETLAACRFWKYMPKARIREQTFQERVQRREMLALVAKVEEKLGRPV